MRTSAGSDDGPGGHLRVITGPMFAGKTSALIAETAAARERGSDVHVFTHALDERYGRDVLASHEGTTAAATAVTDAREIGTAVSAARPDAVAVDEVQFFGVSLVEVVARILSRGADVTVAGLCTTFDSRPYEPVATFLAHAEEVVKLTSECEVCGRVAAYHQLRDPDADADALTVSTVRVGGAEMYEARCRRHVRC